MAHFDLATWPPLMSGCRWIDPISDDYGSVDSWHIRERLGFDAPRLFWLTGVGHDQWRGRHAHRESKLATFALSGGCRLTLDNGRDKQIVSLSAKGPGLLVGPMIWHDLYQFEPASVVLVVASTRYDEAEYIRDYGVFVEEMAKEDHCTLFSSATERPPESN